MELLVKLQVSDMFDGVVVNIDASVDSGHSADDLHIKTAMTTEMLQDKLDPLVKNALRHVCMYIQKKRKELK